MNRPGLATALYVLKGKGGARVRSLREIAKQNGISVRTVGEDFFRSVHHAQGVAVKMQEMPLMDGDALIDSADGGSILFLEGITDPGNLGNCLRVSESAGVQHVALSRHRASPITPAVVTVSSGAAGLLSIGTIHNSRNFLRRLQQRGYWIVGTSPEAESLYDTDLPAPLCIVIGSEERGIKPLTERSCDQLVSLPMMGRIASLNVASATAAILYELVRRRIETAR